MKVAFIGGGNMAGALIGGMLQAGFKPPEIDVLEIDAARGAELTARHSVNTHQQPGDWLQASEIIVLAVKPQQTREAAASIKPYLYAAAGVIDRGGSTYANDCRVTCHRQGRARNAQHACANSRRNLPRQLHYPMSAQPKERARTRSSARSAPLSGSMTNRCSTRSRRFRGAALPTFFTSSKRCKTSRSKWASIKHRRAR